MESEISRRVRELKTIKQEISRLSKELRNLRAQSVTIEKNIIEYLRRTNQPGIRCNGMVILRDAKEERIRKKKAESERDGMMVLRNYGLHRSQADTKKILSDVLEAVRGEKKPKEKLTIN